MGEQKTWREHVHEQIAELEKDIIAVKRKIKKLSDSFTINVTDNGVSKLNVLIFQKGRYEFAQRELYRLLGSVHDE